MSSTPIIAPVVLVFAALTVLGGPIAGIYLALKLNRR